MTVQAEGGSAPRVRRSPPIPRRRFLRLALGGAAAVAVAGAVGGELVEHGVLPGAGRLDALLGACATPHPPLRFRRPGMTVSGTFWSAARRRRVGYTVGYPPDHGPGDRLALIVMLHGFGGDHRTALAGLSPAEAMALEVGGDPLAPMALVTVDGGNGYWTPHPGDDPMAMVVDELVPMCQAWGLGRPPSRIGTMGISMGGYGALAIAEHRPRTVAAVAAISPAIWTSYAQARAVNPGAYASPAAFGRYDAVTHAAALGATAVRVASGRDDPFHPGVVALAAALPKGSDVVFSGGCHTGDFFVAQEPPSLSFLSRHLGGS